MVLGPGDFNGDVGKRVDDTEILHEENQIGERNVKEKRC